ncbi:MAG: MATE family efflux transporter [Oscillospiraceae bacterium]
MNDRNDLTTGSVAKKLIAFALPILGMNLLQAVYNIVDMIIVGQFTDTAAMSAVSIGGLLTSLVLCVCNGLSNGCSVFVARLFGMKKKDEMKSYVGSTLSFLLLLAILFTVGVILLRQPILRALNTPEESFRQTESYLIICMAGTVFVYVYGVFSAALRGIGESLHPLIYVVITTIENVILDLLFVAVLGWGAAGAAAATIISQATSMALVLLFTKRSTELFDFRPASLRIDPQKLKGLLAVGLPQAIQYVCTSISFLLINSLINTYGVAASAAAGAAAKIGSFGNLPGLACMSAIVTMTAQNHPTGNYKRILRGLACGLVVSLSISGAFCLLCQFFPERMYALFTSDPAVAAVGVDYLRLYAICFLTEVTMFCMYGVLTGAGYTTVTMVSSVTMSFAIRYLAAFLLSNYTSLGFNGIGLAYSLAPLLGIAVSICFLVSGKWKTSRITVV